MKKIKPADNPDAYVEGLKGWQREHVTALRKAVRGISSLDEQIKWGHLVYSFDGPVLLIRAEPTRVLFGFWRGRQLQSIEPRLMASGKYEMATLELHEDTEIKPTTARRLARAAVALNRKLGDPRLVAKPTTKRKQKQH